MLVNESGGPRPYPEEAHSQTGRVDIADRQGFKQPTGRVRGPRHAPRGPARGGAPAATVPPPPAGHGQDLGGPDPDWAPARPSDGGREGPGRGQGQQTACGLSPGLGRAGGRAAERAGGRGPARDVRCLSQKRTIGPHATATFQCGSGSGSKLKPHKGPAAGPPLSPASAPRPGLTGLLPRPVGTASSGSGPQSGAVPGRPPPPRGGPAPRLPVRGQPALAPASSPSRPRCVSLRGTRRA